MTAAEALKYEEELKENQRAVRQMVMEGIADVKTGRTQDCNKFFDELEKRYQNA